MKSTIIVNLYGAPGSGKSTAAACLFSVIKSNTVRKVYNIDSKVKVTAEVINEYAKELAWQNVSITKELQQSVCEVQIERERRLLGKVDVIITDSPVINSPFFEHIYHEGKTTVNSVESYRKKLLEDGHIVWNFLLDRCTVYDPKGRYETEEEANHLASMMPVHLKHSWDVHPIRVDMAQPERTKFIFETIFGGK